MNQTTSETHSFSFPLLKITDLTYGLLLRYTPAALQHINRQSHQVKIIDAQVNELQVELTTNSQLVYVTAIHTVEQLQLQCTCTNPHHTLCEFQLQTCFQLIQQAYLRLFFDEDQRDILLRKSFSDYGIPEHANPSEHLEIIFNEGSYTIQSKEQGIIKVDTASLDALKKQLVENEVNKAPFLENSERIIILATSRFQEQFQIDLVDATIGKNNKLRAPIQKIEILDEIHRIDSVSLLKCYSSILRFQNAHRKSNPSIDIQSLKSLFTNPEDYPVYIQLVGTFDINSLTGLREVTLEQKSIHIEITVSQFDQTYKISGKLTIGGKPYELADTQIFFEYFLLAGNSLFLIEDPTLRYVYEYLKSQNNYLIVYEKSYEKFREEILEKINDSVSVKYSYLQPATLQQLESSPFNAPPKAFIYLDEAGEYIHLTPIAQYGSFEVPILSDRIIYAMDQRGVPFEVPRNKGFEIEVATAVIMSHPDFDSQIEKQHFYLSKQLFLEEEWFLKTFASWRQLEIEIKGFERITKNKLSSQKAKVQVSVISGLDWFETKVKVHFGNNTVPLRKLFTAVKNKNRYITLDDGSKGIIPQEWLDRFKKYFELGEIQNEKIITPKLLFQSVEKTYDHQYIHPNTLLEIEGIANTFETFDGIPNTPLPTKLAAPLRNYQVDGFNWLCYLDKLNFGGCLADEMGLGKTVQVIAFLLHQQKLHPNGCNLIVLPTSLLHNWQTELEKFAPSLSVGLFYGESRQFQMDVLVKNNVLITTYNTILANQHYINKYTFNYIILDESQNIKNPNSQRYQAAVSLQSRNRLILTGTPIENNTFDLYGQFSFVCPGLLGSKSYFKDHFFMPIDKFKDTKRAEELRKRLYPFILRRTKQQVASQLPPKTEMILYCEMEPAQRRVYDAYAQEFRNYLNHSLNLELSREQMHVLQGLTKLRQICNSPSLINDNEFYGNHSAKINILVSKLEELIPNHKVLVFSQFVAMLELIQIELESKSIHYRLLTGKTKDRRKEVNTFQNDENERVFLISLKAGGTGLNLTAADYVFLVDPWWNPAVENQAIDRVHRIGQNKPVTAIRLITPQTIEEKIIKLQETKTELSNELINEETNFFKSLTKDDLLSLL